MHTDFTKWISVATGQQANEVARVFLDNPSQTRLTVFSPRGVLVHVSVRTAGRGVLVQAEAPPGPSVSTLVRDRRPGVTGPVTNPGQLARAIERTVFRALRAALVD